MPPIPPASPIAPVPIAPAPSSEPVDWQTDAPFSPRYGDRYHSSSGARAQAGHVFLAGCRLPECWQQDELLTRQLPLLQRAWQSAADRERYHALQGVDAHQAYTSHGVIGDTIEQLLALLTRQGGMFGLAGTLLRAAHPALVAGAFTGSAAVQGVRLRRHLGSSPASSRQED